MLPFENYIYFLALLFGLQEMCIIDNLETQHLEKHSYLQGREDLRPVHFARQETEILWRERAYVHCTSLSDPDQVWGAQSHRQNQNNSEVQPLCRELIEDTFPMQVALAIRCSIELCDVHRCCK